MNELGPKLLLVTALLLGLQHGIDWDHIAAITDLTSTAGEPRMSFLLGTLYALGHAISVTAIGLLAILIGLRLPEWVDGLMEPIVGAILVFLGLWMLLSLVRDGKQFQLRSRWMLLFDGLKLLWDWVTEWFSGVPRPDRRRPSSTYSAKAALIIGIIHGFGAETPSQVLLFLTAAGAGGQLVGSIVLLAFVAGLVISNSAVTIISIFGYNRARRHTGLFIGIGTLTAIFSLAIGGLFLTGRIGLLPPILPS